MGEFMFCNNCDKQLATGAKFCIECGVSTKQSMPGSIAGELRQYKELLDSGVISQEEYDKTKNEIINRILRYKKVCDSTKCFYIPLK